MQAFLSVLAEFIVTELLRTILFEIEVKRNWNERNINPVTITARP